MVIWVGALASMWLLRNYPLRPSPARLMAAYLLAWGLVAILGGAPRSVLRERFVLSTAALCLTLGLPELVSRLGWVDFRQVFATPMNDPKQVADPELLHLRKPYTHEVGETKGDLGLAWCLGATYEYDVVYDRYGFRNRTDLRSADIALVGDSYIEASLIPDSQLVSSILARLQQGTVANLGQGWHGPQQELAVLERYALPLRPHTVVWFFFEGNDLSDLRGYDASVASARAGLSGDVPARERSFLVNATLAVNRVLFPHCPPDYVASNRSGVVKDTLGRRVQMYFGYEAAPLSDEDLQSLTRMQSIFAAAYQRCRSAGSRMMVAFIPIKFRVYEDIAEFDVDAEPNSWTLSDLPQRLRNVTQAISDKIEYVDLTPAFREEARRGAVLYFPDDTHWSPAGHALAAQVISAALNTR
jgi:hypothetical protein